MNPAGDDRALSLRRSLRLSFALMAVMTALTLYVAYRIHFAQTLAVVRDDEIARCQGLAEGIRSVAEEALDEGIPYAVVGKLVERGLKGVEYIRVERIDGSIVAETAVAHIPERPMKTAGVMAIPDADAPRLYDIAIPLGTRRKPNGFVRIGLAESSIRERALAGVAPLRMTALLSSAFLLASSLVGFLFLTNVYRRAQVREDRLRERERQAYLGTVAAGIVHDVRHPLGSIQLGIDLAREELRGEHIDQATNRLALLQDEFRRAQFALDSFRDYAMQGEFRKRTADLRALVEDVVHLVRNTLAARSITVGAEGMEQAPAPVDPPRFKQAILNLLLNAAEAMESGGRLRIALAREEHGIRIDVIDTGKGIPKEMLAQIFQPYYTTKERGMGIGLSIVKQTVEEHGGMMSVSSDATGTVFRLHFPER